MALTKNPKEILKKTKNPLLGKRDYNRIDLKEIANVKNGFAFKSSKFNTEGNGIPIIRIRDIGEDKTNTYYEGDYSREYVVNKGDLLVGMDGDFKIAFWRDGQALLNQRVCRIDIDPEKYNSKFLYYYLQPFLDEIHNWTSSVTVKHLSSSTIQNIPLIDIKLSEQQTIVQTLDSLFSKIDAGEEGLKKVEKQLEVYREVLLNSVFDDNWNYEPFKVLIAEGPQNGVYYPQSLYGKGIAIIRIDDYQNFYNKPVSQLRIVDAPMKDIEKYKLFKNDLIINRVNSMTHIGKSMVVGDKHLPSIFESNMMRIRLKDNVIADFIDLYLKSPKGRSRLIANAKQAVNQASINQHDVKSTLVPIINKDEQEKIVLKLKRELSVIDTVNELIRNQQKISKSLRQSILKKAFSGKLI